MNHKLIVTLTSALLTNITLAATQVDLRHQSAHYIKPYFLTSSASSSGLNQLQVIRTDVDFNQTSHVRLQQLYLGLPVWNATPVVHLPKLNNQLGVYASLNQHTAMNGVIYEGLDKDLGVATIHCLSKSQKDKAIKKAQLAFEKKWGLAGLSYAKESVKTIVYVDKTKQAHYAFLVSFYYDDGATGAHRPTSIMDADSLFVYRNWDAVLSEKSGEIEVEEAFIGGVGGNEKIGEVIYDGVDDHLPAMKAKHFQYNGKQGPASYQLDYCILMNDDIAVYDVSYMGVNPLSCLRKKQDESFFWLSIDNHERRWKADEVNGGYSPSLDAFYGANIVNDFYREWYGVPALVEEDGKTPMQLKMRVHYGRNFENAFWDGEQMTFGDGGVRFYPLTSLDITAHEVSHGFTSQHSGLDYSNPQMGALHEAFSDAAAIAMQYYVTGKSNWDIGRDIKKDEGALRYLDNPKKDGSSIDNMNDFDDTEVHAGAGIFNKAFYLIATTKGWDIRKAFDVMVKANMNYWNSSMTTLTEAACGVVAATEDYGYNLADVRVSFAKVGIDTAECS
ncbi:MAG: M4 family metallopeptidase [Legionellaceae bacterium]|nr:M4 family metallopeptidase [Legionellaceae bacterium]